MSENILNVLVELLAEQVENGASAEKIAATRDRIIRHNRKYDHVHVTGWDIEQIAEKLEKSKELLDKLRPTGDAAERIPLSVNSTSVREKAREAVDLEQAIVAERRRRNFRI